MVFACRTCSCCLSISDVNTALYSTPTGCGMSGMPVAPGLISNDIAKPDSALWSFLDRPCHNLRTEERVLRGMVETDRHGEDRLRLHGEMLDRTGMGLIARLFVVHEIGSRWISSRYTGLDRSPRPPDETSPALLAWHLMPDADALPPSCSNLLVSLGSHQ
jgi:hypothetical protein